VQACSLLSSLWRDRLDRRLRDIGRNNTLSPRCQQRPDYQDQNRFQHRPIGLLGDRKPASYGLVQEITGSFHSQVD